MCIRDRLWALLGGDEHDAACDGGGGPLGGWEGADQVGAGAVSYTHLRAHETVLDLVCRLLLEKKNKAGHTSLYTDTTMNIH